MRSTALFSSAILLGSLFVAPCAAHPASGIVVAESGDVYVSDVERNIIWKVSRDGSLIAFANGLHSHSIAMDHRGSIYAEHLRFVPENTTDRQWDRTLFQLVPSGDRRTILGPTLTRES